MEHSTELAGIIKEWSAVVFLGVCTLSLVAGFFRVLIDNTKAMIKVADNLKTLEEAIRGCIHRK